MAFPTFDPADLSVQLTANVIVNPPVFALSRFILVVRFLPSAVVAGNILVRDLADTTTYVSIPVQSTLTDALEIGVPVRLPVPNVSPVGFGFKTDSASLNGLLVVRYAD